MRKIDNLFLFGGIVAIGALSCLLWSGVRGQGDAPIKPEFETSKYGAFLAAQHAVYINDFDTAADYMSHLGDVDYTVVKNTKLVADFLSGHMPADVESLKDAKKMPEHLIYDAYLASNEKWTELHNRHKTDSSALGAPLRIWPAIANNWQTNTFKFIDGLPTNSTWKAFVRGQIYAELGKVDKAAEEFAKVTPDFMNINDYLYLMSFYKHNGMTQDMDILRADFTARPGGMFMLDYPEIPDWSEFSGYKNALAFSIIQNVSHTQIMMYSDMAILLLRFVDSMAPDFAKNTQSVDYYLGQYYYTNDGDYRKQFNKIDARNPYHPFAMMRLAEKDGDIASLQKLVRAHPLFVPAVNKLIAHYIRIGDKRAAMRVVQGALENENLDEMGRAFFTKSRAQIHFVFDDIDAAQSDIRTASDTLGMDAEIISLQAKIWATQQREIETAYEYAMSLVKQNPADVLAWDTVGFVVLAREGEEAALEVYERVGSVSGTCSSLFMHMGDIYAARGDYEEARASYMRAIDLSDDGLTVVPEIERKLRKLK